MTIQQWIVAATAQLTKAGITSARLDAELLLTYTLRRTRTSLHAHPKATIPAAFLPVLAAQLQLRTERVPMAYILGHKEFYGRTFTVTPATLVPRPESETIITQLLALEGISTQPKTLIDVGTGSGILGITSKLELPHLTITLSDISPAALRIAQYNATQLGASVAIAPVSHLLSQQTKSYDYIIANLPYVATEWSDTSPELQYEPQTALYADNHGLALIYELLPQAAKLLTPNGYLLLEADPTQHDAIIAHAKHISLTTHLQQDYCLVLTQT